MPRDTLEFRVVVASPSDVYEARKIVFDAILELNRIFEAQNVSIRGLGWEEYASPGIDIDAQTLINKQILRDYDILVAIFGTKLGSPTVSEKSGTVAEIEQAIKKQNSPMGSHRVQVYFCDQIASITSVSIDELKRLEDYRKSLDERGILYRTYKNIDELQKEVRINLQRPIYDFLQKHGAHSRTAPNILLERERTEDSNSAANSLNSTEENRAEDLGVLDHQEKAEAAITAGNESISAMSDLMQEITAETNRRTARLDSISSPLASTAEKKKFINDFAAFLKSKASQLKQEALTSRLNFTDFFDAMAFIIEFSRELTDQQRHEAALSEFLKEGESVLGNIPKAREGVSTMKRTVESLPRITIQFNQAKRLLVDALADCISAFENIEFLLADLLSKGHS